LEGQAEMRRDEQDRNVCNAREVVNTVWRGRGGAAATVKSGNGFSLEWWSGRQVIGFMGLTPGGKLPWSEAHSDLRGG
jgi:hypothetical protein